MTQAAASSIELALLAWAFRYEDGRRYRLEASREGTHQNDHMKEASKNKVTWICACFFLAYVGAEGIPPFRPGLEYLADFSCA